jgi:hypothetical protein
MGGWNGNQLKYHGCEMADAMQYNWLHPIHYGSKSDTYRLSSFKTPIKQPFRMA